MIVKCISTTISKSLKTNHGVIYITLYTRGGSSPMILSYTACKLLFIVFLFPFLDDSVGNLVHHLL